MPRHRIPLGAFPQGGYQVIETPMERGDVVLAYSDGVLDSLSPSGEFFGVERLMEVLESCPAKPEEIVTRVLQAVDTFAESQAAYDDITVLAVSCCPEDKTCEDASETCSGEDT